MFGDDFLEVSCVEEEQYLKGRIHVELHILQAQWRNDMLLVQRDKCGQSGTIGAMQLREKPLSLRDNCRRWIMM